jgi:hypothetical protein
MTDVLPNDLATAAARAGADVTLPERELEDAIRDAFTHRRGYVESLSETLPTKPSTIATDVQLTVATQHVACARRRRVA